MSETLTCVYVTDKVFLPCTCFSIVSVVKAASEPLDVHVLYADQDRAAMTTAKDYVAAQGAPATFTILGEDAFAGLARPKALPLATYGRLLMQNVLPANPARVLYIDGDTLADIDVAPLSRLPLKGSILGAVLDVGRVLVGRREEAQRRLDLGPDGDYFNAGVLLIDWARWRGESIGEATLRALASDPTRFTQADQCALNYTCRGQWAKLDFRWNYQPANVLYQDRDNAVFHFLGGRKPWVASQNRHPMRFVRRYAQLYATSPWADQFAPPTLPYWTKSMIRLARSKGASRYWANRDLYRRTIARIEADIAAAPNHSAHREETTA